MGTNMGRNMGSMNKILAERDVDRFERDAESQWRTDGRAVPLTNVTNDVLRERLIDTLADVEPMRKLVKEINENASEAVADLRLELQSTINDPALRGADESEVSEVNKAFVRCVEAEPRDLPVRFVELLTDVIAYYRQREPAEKTDDAAATIVAPALPPRTKRLRTGATTIPLPFLFSHSEGKNVAVNDMMPSALVPVKSAAGEKKKRAKAEKKAA